jgi:hypothetical protein
VRIKKQMGTGQIGASSASMGYERDLIAIMASWRQSEKRLRKSRQRALKLLLSLADERLLALRKMPPAGRISNAESQLPVSECET